MSDYYKKNYAMNVQETNDELQVDKISGTDWCDVTMTTNGNENGKITIRSKVMAEQLHFMLGQMLG